MNKSHALAVAAILALAAVFGFSAATKTAGLRSANATASSAGITARIHRLDRIEASLRRALRAKPPALPPLPAARAAAPSAPQVVYRRPAPIVVVKHRPNSEAEHERESGD
jgi:hypothetical protein